MKRKFGLLMSLLLLISIAISSSGCTESYSKGEVVGFITELNQTGIVWKSWEIAINPTQTGMNSSTIAFKSIDNDNEPNGLVNTLNEAFLRGWKVKLIYHETFGKNWFNNRGNTDFFVTECIILDKNPLKDIVNNRPEEINVPTKIDTIKGKIK